MKPQLIFLGPPGSGKGTQAGILVRDFDYKHLSTGDLLRVQMKKKDSPLAEEIRQIMKNGLLVDDLTVLKLLKDNCDLEQHHYIFDGHPRTLEQAKDLSEHILQDKEFLVIHFILKLSKLKNRLVGRRICSCCQEIFNLKSNPPKRKGLCDKCNGELTHRNDDKEEVIKNRLEIFNKQIKPILQYYKNNLYEIDANHSLHKITGKIKEILNRREIKT